MSSEAALLTLQFAAITARMADEELSVEDRRRLMERFTECGAPPGSVSSYRSLAPDPIGVWFEESESLGVVVYCHGGGYMFGSTRSHHNLTAQLAAASGCSVLSLDYRLAPEYPYPAAVDDVISAYRWLLANGSAPGNIAFGGDSAGGGLIMSALLKIRDLGLPQPSGAVLLSPWVDLDATGATVESNAASDVQVTSAGLTMAARAYLGNEASPGGVWVDPLNAGLVGLCPLHIQVGQAEILLDDARRLAATAERDGVVVVLDEFPHMQHVFQMGAGAVPESTTAVQRLGTWVRQGMKTS